MKKKRIFGIAGLAAVVLAASGGIFFKKVFSLVNTIQRGMVI